MQELSPNFYIFSGLLVGRVYAIIDEATVTLIDTGLGLAATRVLAQLRQGGYAPEQVTRILITHAHNDHVGGLPALRAATGAQVYCSAIEKPVLEGDTPPVMPEAAQRTPFDKLMYPRPQTIQPVPVNVALAEGDVLDSPIGPLQVLGAAGHTPGQIAFWQAGRKLLVCGDALMNVWGLRVPIPPFTQNLQIARATIKRLAALEPAILCPGHGAPVTENTAAHLRQFADSL